MKKYTRRKIPFQNKHQKCIEIYLHIRNCSDVYRRQAINEKRKKLCSKGQCCNNVIFSQI